MQTRKISFLRLYVVTLLTTIFFVLPAAAEQSQTFEEYTIHYSAIGTGMLTPEVAKGYEILRSKNRALLSISIMKNQAGDLPGSINPVKARVTATATNLVSQMRKLSMRELEDAGAIYYIAEIPVRDEEILNFKIQVRPQGSEKSFDLKFKQQFFTE